MNIIFDFNRTLFNPETGSLYPGALPLLRALATRHTLFLMSKRESGREHLLEELGIESCFKKALFVEQKTKEDLSSLVDGAKNTLVVGDRIKREITLGNQLGFFTVWVKQGRFADEMPTADNEEPDYTIQNIQDLDKIISTYETQ